MEKQIQTKMDEEFVIIKQKIQEELVKQEFAEKDKMLALFQFINELEKPVMNFSEFLPIKKERKLKEPKEQCVAIISNGKQCLRKKTKNGHYCGTHEKQMAQSGLGLPSSSAEDDSTMHQLEVEIKEILGIPYYIDKYGNIYKHEEIHQKNPAIIGHWNPLTEVIDFVV